MAKRYFEKMSGQNVLGRNVRSPWMVHMIIEICITHGSDSGILLNYKSQRFSHLFN